MSNTNLAISRILTNFAGRGFYLTAFMNPECLLVANYALLTALLITSGVTGWVGSTGGFYLYSVRFSAQMRFYKLTITPHSLHSTTLHSS